MLRSGKEHHGFVMVKYAMGLSNREKGQTALPPIITLHIVVTTSKCIRPVSAMTFTVVPCSEMIMKT